MTASKVVKTLNPDMRQLTLEEVKAELPQKIAQIQQLKGVLSQFTVGSIGWTAVAKSHDALVRQARRYRNFINAHYRAEQAQAEFIRKMATGQIAMEVEQLIKMIEELGEE